MNKQTGTHSTITQPSLDDAEGSPDKSERQEPPSPKRVTYGLTSVATSNYSKISETGLIPMVKLREADDNSDGQDAFLTDSDTANDTEAIAMSDVITKDIPVLVLEDTVELAEVIQATLEGLGMSVEHVTQGKLGVEKIKAQTPKVLLLDIGLPDITGWKVLEEVKDHYTQNEMPMPITIVITAYGDPANRLIGKLQNIYTYLIKPFTPDEVEKVVMQALRGEAPDAPSIGG